MYIENILLDDIVIIKKEPVVDSRGFFERIYCHNEYEKLNIDFDYVQQNISFNSKKGTIRGLHYQQPPFGEKKIIQCLRGKIMDVLLDIDADSKNYGKCVCVELSDENNRMIYVPEHYAHGFQTLMDNTLLLYFMGNYYNSDAARGYNCFSELLDIEWPINEKYIISDKDSKLPFFGE